MEQSDVWRARPVNPKKLDSADRVFSAFLCDPDRYDEIKYQILDEVPQRVAYLRHMTDEEKDSYWQDEQGRRVPTDYRHYKSRQTPPEDET